MTTNVEQVAPKSRKHRADPAAQKELSKAAGRYKLAYQAKDVSGAKTAGVELLRAARQWRDSARTRAARGLPDKQCPTFNTPPKPLDRDNPPDRKKYYGALYWWASKYAWDVADGDREAAMESARNLLRVASIGAKSAKREKPVKKEKAA